MHRILLVERTICQRNHVLQLNHLVFPILKYSSNSYSSQPGRNKLQFYFYNHKEIHFQKVKKMFFHLAITASVGRNLQTIVPHDYTPVQHSVRNFPSFKLTYSLSYCASFIYIRQRVSSSILFPPYLFSPILDLCELKLQHTFESTRSRASNKNFYNVDVSL